MTERTTELVSFEKCIRAIAETMAQQDPLPTASKSTVDAVTSFLMATHARMPDYMRVGSWILVMTFDAWPYLTSGRPFHRLDLRRRNRQIAGWEHSVGFRRSLVAFIRALVTFGLSTERDKSGKEDACERAHRQG